MRNQKLPNCFQSKFSILQSHQLCMRIPILCSLTNICYCLSFLLSCPTECEMVSHCGFNLHFSDDWTCSIYLCMLIGRWHILFREMFIHILRPFLNWVICWVMKVLYVFWIKVPYHIHHLQIFLPYYALSFHFPNGVFWSKKVLFVFCEIQCIYFFFCCFATIVTLKKALPMPQIFTYIVF